MIMKLILSVIKICSCFALCFSSIVYAVDCPVPPTEVTNPQPTTPEMTYPDLKGRDFEFYDKSYALLIGESRYPQKPLTSVPAELRKLRSTLEGQGFYVSPLSGLEKYRIL